MTEKTSSFNYEKKKIRQFTDEKIFWNLFLALSKLTLVLILL